MSEEKETKLENTEEQTIEAVTQQEAAKEQETVSEQTEQVEQTEQKEQTEQTEQTEQVEQIEQKEQMEQPVEQEKTEQSPDTDRSTDKKAQSKWKKPAIIAGIAALVIAGGLFGYSQTPGQRLNSCLSLGNRYLNEVDYEQAVTEFSKALEIEPRNEEALKGILEVAARTNDQELFQNAFESLLEVYQGDDSLSEEEWATLVQMALAAEQYYSETSYMELIQEIMTDTEDPALKQRYMDILNEEADREWKQNNYEAVLDKLEEAYGMDPENEQIKEELIRVVKAYVDQCRKNQQYEKGMEKIEWLRNLLGDPELLKEQEDSLTAMQETDSRIQEVVNQLNVCFENDDVDGIMSLMGSEEWKSQTASVYKVFYSQNLLETSEITGKGTGIYNYYGTIYVYYGNYVNGVRQGQGLWYSYNDKYNSLDKYDLNWENGVPQGHAESDRYTTLTTYGYGGVVLRKSKSHQKESFEVVNGIYDGEVIDDSTDSKGGICHMVINYVNGAGVVVDTPSDIQPYLQKGEQIIGWGIVYRYGEDWGSRMWYSYSTDIRRIPGIYTTTSYTVNSVTLE